ncbi:MAG: hypothetical protein M3323_11720 [Actinomycetota bacterium]|nr:hypothetical protein [Actinomycetota bacterium]
MGLLLAVLGIAAPVSAHDHRLPKSVLRISDERQPGHPVHSTWLKRVDEEYCDVSDRFALPIFPSPVRARAGEIASIQLKKPAPPREFSLRAWFEVNGQGHPEGDPIPIAAILSPVSGMAQTGSWQLHFVPPPDSGHLYLLAEVNWADEEGCSPQPDLGSQYAAWTFHLRVD